MREKLEALGYKTFIEHNTLFIEADYTKDPSAKDKIMELMKDYKKSYGIRCHNG